VAALCRDLGRVQQRLSARGAPDLACLVVRVADGLPGIGWFASERAEGTYAGPPEGPSALAHLRACQERAFAWAATADGASSAADEEPRRFPDAPTGGRQDARAARPRHRSGGRARRSRAPVDRGS
jgi:hypothetical protein